MLKIMFTLMSTILFSLSPLYGSDLSEDLSNPTQIPQPQLVAQLVVETDADGNLNVEGIQDEDWSVVLSPVVWVPSVDGSLEELGLVTDVEASQHSRLDHLSPGGELLFELKKGRLTLGIQPQYSKAILDGQTVTPLGDIASLIRSRRFLLEYWVGYTLGGDEDRWVQIIAGGRHMRLSMNGESPLGASASEIENNDPLIGIRARRRLTERWSIEGMVTKSGFEFSDSSTESSWEARLGAHFKVGRRFSLQIGYREFKTKSSSEKQGLPQNLQYKLKGLFIGGVYKVR